jgi:ADP-ribose pyrophosphatase
LHFVAGLALRTFGRMHDAAEGDGRNNEEQRQEAHAGLEDEITGEAAGAAAHDFGGALGAPEEDFCSNDQHRIAHTRRDTIAQVARYSVGMAKKKTGNTSARVLSSKEVYRGPVFWVTSDRVVEPGNIEVRRDIVRHPGSVVVLAVDERGKEPRILLEVQYRYTVGGKIWELPAGRIDPGETELAGAKRELLEETGFTARSWKRILRFYASPGFLAETMSVFLARGLKPGIAQPEADEVIDVRFVPLSKALKMVKTGQIGDAKTICGVLWLKQYGNHL